MEYRQHTENCPLSGRNSAVILSQTFGLTPSQYAISHGQELTKVQRYRGLNLIAIHPSCQPCNIYILIRINNLIHDDQLCIDLEVVKAIDFIHREPKGGKNATIKRQRGFCLCQGFKCQSASIQSTATHLTAQIRAALSMPALASSTHVRSCVFSVGSACVARSPRNLELHYCFITGINYAENFHFLHFSRQNARGVTCQCLSESRGCSVSQRLSVS